jgi:hypothetical protein
LIAKDTFPVPLWCMERLFLSLDERASRGTQATATTIFWTESMQHDKMAAPFSNFPPLDERSAVRLIPNPCDRKALSLSPCHRPDGPPFSEMCAAAAAASS